MFTYALHTSNHLLCLNTAHHEDSQASGDEVFELEPKNKKKITWLQNLTLKFCRRQRVWWDQNFVRSQIDKICAAAWCNNIYSRKQISNKTSTYSGFCGNNINFMSLAANMYEYSKSLNWLQAMSFQKSLKFKLNGLLEIYWSCASSTMCWAPIFPVSYFSLHFLLLSINNALLCI